MDAPQLATPDVVGGVRNFEVADDNLTTAADLGRCRRQRPKTQRRPYRGGAVVLCGWPFKLQVVTSKPFAEALVVTSRKQNPPDVQLFSTLGKATQAEWHWGCTARAATEQRSAIIKVKRWAALPNITLGKGDAGARSSGWYARFREAGKLGTSIGTTLNQPHSYS